jgi:hypothetical protein
MGCVAPGEEEEDASNLVSSLSGITSSSFV